MREKLKFNHEANTMAEALGITDEREAIITGAGACGLGREHTLGEHLEAMYNREDVTDAEIAYIFFVKGLQAAHQEIAERFLSGGGQPSFIH